MEDDMESDIYLTDEEAKSLRTNGMLLFSNTPWREMGLQWIYERGQYQIVDKKQWMLTKIKYGI